MEIIEYTDIDKNREYNIFAHNIFQKVKNLLSNAKFAIAPTTYFKIYKDKEDNNFGFMKYNRVFLHVDAIVDKFGTSETKCKLVILKIVVHELLHCCQYKDFSQMKDKKYVNKLELATKHKTSKFILENFDKLGLDEDTVTKYMYMLKSDILVNHYEPFVNIEGLLVYALQETCRLSKDEIYNSINLDIETDLKGTKHNEKVKGLFKFISPEKSVNFLYKSMIEYKDSKTMYIDREYNDKGFLSIKVYFKESAI